MTWTVALALVLQGLAVLPVAAPEAGTLAHDLAVSLCRAGAGAEHDSDAVPTGPRHAKPFCCAMSCCPASPSSKPFLAQSGPALLLPAPGREPRQFAISFDAPAAARISEAQPRAPPLS